MKQSLPQKYPKTTLLLVNLLLFAFLELGLRTLGRKNEPTSTDQPLVWRGVLYTPISDEQVHHQRWGPNAVAMTVAGPRDTFPPVEVRINSCGIRGPDIKPATVPRILFVGDSFIEADEVLFEDTFSEQLNRASGGRMDFVAHGVTSWAPTTEFSWIHHRGMELLPTQIVLFLCWNDFFPADTYPQTDAVYRSEAIWEDGAPVRYIYPWERFKKEHPKLAALERVADSLLSNVYFARLAHQGWQALFRRISPPLSPREACEAFSKPADRWPGALRRSVEETIEVVGRLDTYLMKRNVRLAVALVPNPMAWPDEVLAIKRHNPDWQQMVARAGLAPEEFTLSQDGLEKHLRDSFRQRRIEWLELGEAFRQVKNQEAILLYNEEDGHWNKHGHQVVAEVLKRKYLN